MKMKARPGRNDQLCPASKPARSKNIIEVLCFADMEPRSKVNVLKDSKRFYSLSRAKTRVELRQFTVETNPGSIVKYDKLAP